MIFTSAEKRQRSRAFDRMVYDVDWLLLNPTVVEALGAERTARLKAINNGVFLPNFDGETISMTRRQRRSEGGVLLPLTAEERSRPLRMAESGLWPVQSTIEKLQTTVPEARSMLKGKIADAIEYQDADRIVYTETHEATTHHQYYSFKNVAIASRSALFTKTEHVTRPKNLHLGAAILHEYVHFDQNSGVQVPLAPEMRRCQSATHEFEAHWTGFTAMEASGMSHEEIQAESTQTFDVEMYRRRNADPEQPFTATEKMADTLQIFGVI
jgi:hypothetical protein